MHVEIVTHIAPGQRTYRVCVFVDGEHAGDHSATARQVTSVRNRLINQWTRVADSVAAAPIPQIFGHGPTIATRPRKEQQ